MEAPLPRAWPRCDSPLSAAGERREGGREGREGGEGEGAGREGAGGGGPGTGGLEGARQQPGRRQAESERGPGRAPCLPSPAAALATPHFVIRRFSRSAGAGVRWRDGLAQLDPAGLVYYGR